VKSTNHFYAEFAPLATKVLWAEGGGSCPIDHRKYPYAKIPRPLWPHDQLPPGRLLI
jgi:microcystin degradation protein MlrC